MGVDQLGGRPPAEQLVGGRAEELDENGPAAGEDVSQEPPLVGKQLADHCHRM